MPSHNRIQSLRQRAFFRQAGLCCYCGVRMWLNSPAEVTVTKRAKAATKLRCTAEHLQPRSEGGRDTPSNIAAACAHCNQARHKRKKPPQPAAYRQEVRRRVEHGSWHARWVFDTGLLARTTHVESARGARSCTRRPHAGMD